MCIFFRRRKPGDPPGGTGDIAFKVALDRFVLTPPYLAITLATLRLLQGLGVKRSLGETRALYKGVLFTNWKVGLSAAHCSLLECMRARRVERKMQEPRYFLVSVSALARGGCAVKVNRWVSMG